MADQVDELRKSIEDLTAAIKSGNPASSNAAPASSAPIGSGSPKSGETLAIASSRTATGFDSLAGKMKSFGLAMLSVGTILRGLSGTREGYQLNYSLNHLFYELADMLREPIRFLTNEIEGAARVLHVLGQSGNGASRAISGAAIGAGLAGPPGAAIGGAVGTAYDKIDQLNKAVHEANRNQVRSDNLQQQAQGDVFSNAVIDTTANRRDRAMSDLVILHDATNLAKIHLDIAKRGENTFFGGKWGHERVEAAEADLKVAQARENSIRVKVEAMRADAKPTNQKFPNTPSTPRHYEKDSNQNDHLRPLLRTSFGDVQGLQNRIQALTTENPAQERGLSLIEQIAKAVWVIAYGQDAANKAFPEPVLRTRAG